MFESFCTLAGLALWMLLPWAGHAARQDSPGPATVQSSLASRLLKIEEADGDVREAARRDLLSTTVSELPELREALESLAAQRKASPSIIRLAYDATVHAHVREAKLRFLAEQPANQRSGEPFLGILLGGDVTSNTPGNPSGVAVRSTNPGFVAYEALEEGDLLLAIRTPRGLERLSHFGDLQSAFYGLSPGDQIEFLVMRGGAVVRVPLRLDERPEPRSSNPNQQRWEMVAAEARRAAAVYWEEQIAPVLPPPAVPVARSE